MGSHTPTYLAGALAAIVAGTVIYSSVKKSAPLVDINKAEWCEVDSRGRSQDVIYSDFAKHYKVEQNSLGKKMFIDEVLSRNGWNLEKPRIMLPCGL